MPRRLAAVAALTLGLSLSAHADTLRIAIPADPGYLDPAFYGSTSEQILIDNLYPRLAKYVPGDTWKVALDAANSVDLSDPQNIKFELNPGQIWSGGYGELTAEDVKYSGLGTFDSLDGEGLMLDGQVYHAMGDGTVSEAPDSASAPFWVSARFTADRSANLAAVEG